MIKAENVELSVIVPAFNEEGNIKKITDKLCSICSALVANYEIIIINDGSYDNTQQIAEELSLKNNKIKNIRFSKNFGHQAALLAGYDYAKGQVVVSIDADLQHPPELIKEMYEKWQEGFKVVLTKRVDNEDYNFITKMTSKLFYKIFNFITNVTLEKGAVDFRLLDRIVIEKFKLIREHNRFLPGIISWIGFSQTFVEYTARSRNAGESKYSFLNRFKLAVTSITAFSSFPLYLFAGLGVIVSLLSGCYGVYEIIHTLFTGHKVPGYTSIIVCVLFFGGLQLLGIGVIGVYIGKIYDEVKNRPHYIIKSMGNIKNENTPSS